MCVPEPTYWTARTGRIAADAPALDPGRGQAAGRCRASRLSRRVGDHMPAGAAVLAENLIRVSNARRTLERDDE